MANIMNRFTTANPNDVKVLTGELREVIKKNKGCYGTNHCVSRKAQTGRTVADYENSCILSKWLYLVN